MMRFLYTAIYYLAIPFVLLRLLWRSRHTIGYRKRWHERFGFIASTSRDSIWFHAVSVGETLAAIPLITEIHALYASTHDIIVTTTTPTGSALVTQHLKNTVLHTYAPFDIPTAISRFIKRVNPKICIIMETEMWPNLLTGCKKNHIPVILANARLSERSMRHYRFVRTITKYMLDIYQLVAAQGVLDGERFLQLGLDPKKLVISGNVKFDLTIPDEIILSGKKIRAHIGENKKVWIAASTHEGEEAIILNAFLLLREKIPDVFLILVPRHPNRVPKIITLFEQKNISPALRSKNNMDASHCVLIVDTIGELKLFYAASDVAFVGGSLTPIGGHNVIEPAALGLPILSGPHYHNFNEIGKLLLDAGALQIVIDAASIENHVSALFFSADLREKIALSAKKTIEANRGALDKHVQYIQSIISGVGNSVRTA